ncbi:MAG: hypothetical protein II924_03360, partial [Kiritimatiellae bacterium]|nr:hypothetical protein [Kiritimatiellia bacterium]
MAKKDNSSVKKGAEPPSLFDNLDLFAPPPAPEPAATPRTAKGEPPPPPKPKAGLTGAGPMRDLYDFNFR